MIWCLWLIWTCIKNNQTWCTLDQKLHQPLHMTFLGPYGSLLRMKELLFLNKEVRLFIFRNRSRICLARHAGDGSRIPWWKLFWIVISRGNDFIIWCHTSWSERIKVNSIKSLLDSPLRWSHPTQQQTWGSRRKKLQKNYFNHITLRIRHSRWCILSDNFVQKCLTGFDHKQHRHLLSAKLESLGFLVAPLPFK